MECEVGRLGGACADAGVGCWCHPGVVEEVEIGGGVGGVAVEVAGIDGVEVGVVAGVVPLARARPGARASEVALGVGLVAEDVEGVVEGGSWGGALKGEH